MRLKDIKSGTYLNIFGNCKTFDDIYDIAEDMSKKEKGDLMEIISYYILKLSPELNVDLQEIWLYDDVPTKLLKSLNLPSKDKGIDLIVQIDGEYFAVQSKFRQNKDTVIKWDEMATFYGLSFGVGEKIKGGLFITNTVDMCNEVNNSKKVRVISGNFFMENLPDNFFKNICLDIKNKQPLEYVKKEPFLHQQQCIQACIDYFNKNVELDNKSDYSDYSNYNDSEFEDNEYESDCYSEISNDTIESYSDDNCVEILSNYSDCDVDETVFGLDFKDNDYNLDSDCDVDETIFGLDFKNNDYNSDDDYDIDETIFDVSDEEDDDVCDFTRAQVQLACGAGKSLISYWIDQKLNNNISLFLVPSLNLLSQFYSDIVNQSYAEKQKLKFLLIGSDVDTDNEIETKVGCLNLHIDPREIRQCIDKSIEQESKLTIICTYQSAMKLAVACRLNNKEIQIDFGVFDEAHKTVGQKDKLFSLMLDDKNLVIKKRLFMTATTKMYKGKMNEDDTKDVLSMDNESVYGKKVFTYNVDQAIKEKRLVNYDIISLVATDAEIKKLIKDNKLVSFQKEFTNEESNYLGTILMLLKKIHDGTTKHLLTYHNTVKRGQKFCEFMTKINNLLYKNKICVDTFSGNTSMAKRNRLIKDFTKSGVGVLCTARVLNEGVNIPIIDSVCFVDERQSTIDIVQCVGRMLRLYQDKTMAHVFIPTFITSLEDEDIGGGAFANTIRILKAMKSVDGDITEYFMLKSEGKPIVGCQIVKFEGVVFVDGSKQIELDKWSNVVETKIWEVVDSFEFKKNLLFQFVEEHNRIPYQREKYNDIKIGTWCQTQRINKRINKLDKYKIDQLNKITGWFWNKIDLFDKQYDELKKWTNEHKKIPSAQSKNLIEKQLGGFCNNQRVLKKKNQLNNYKINKLIELKEWYWADVNLTIRSFDENYNELIKWINEYKKIPLSQSKDLIEKQLGQFCNNQRVKKKKNKLSKHKIVQLEKIKIWYWHNDIIIERKPFDEKYDELKKWTDKNKKIPSMQSKNLIEKQLGTFCANQKSQRKQNKLDKNKIENLEKLIGWSWYSDEIKVKKLFDEQYDELVKWINENKKIPNKNNEDSIENLLGLFCQKQRNKKRVNKLDKNKISQLEKLEGWSWGKSEFKLQKTFDENYEELKKWININKKIPSSCSKNLVEKQFGQFCASQRQNKKNNNLDKHKIDQLNHLESWYWDEYELKIKTFNENYEKLIKWISENNKMPSYSSNDLTEKNLGSWCSRQRTNKKNNKLNDYEICKLETIYYWYWSKDDSDSELEDEKPKKIPKNKPVKNKEKVIDDSDDERSKKIRKDIVKK